MRSYQLAFLNLWRRKTTTLIAISAIALSVASSGILLRLYLLSNSRFSTMAKGADAVVGAKSGGIEIMLGSLNLEGDFPDFIPYRLFESLRDQQTVQFEDGTKENSSFSTAVIPFVFFGKFKQERLIGTDENFLKTGMVLREGRWAKDIGEVVAGSGVGLTIGQEIDAQTWVTREEGEAGNLKLKVVGIFQSTGSAWDFALFSNLSQARIVFAAESAKLKSIWGPDVLHYYFVFLKPGGFKALENLINRRTVAQAINITMEKDKLIRLTGAGQRLAFLISILIMSLGALSVMAMMVTRFDAMTVQMAVLRAIGYSKFEVTAWLLWEGIFLGLVASGIGALLDFLFFPLVKEMLASTLPNSQLIASPLFQSAPLWGACLLGTMIAAGIPLLRLYRQDIHSALKGL